MAFVGDISRAEFDALLDQRGGPVPAAAIFTVTSGACRIEVADSLSGLAGADDGGRGLRFLGGHLEK